MTYLLNPYISFPDNAGASYAYIDSAVNAGDLTVYDFGGSDLGEAVADRYVIVGYADRSVSFGRTLSSITIGGVSSNIVASATQTTESNLAGFVIANVPTGATGNIVVTFNDFMNRCGISWWRATGLSSAIPDTTATDSDGSNPQTGSLTVENNGFAVGVGVGNSGAPAATWSGLTERTDETIESTVTLTAADDSFPSGGTPSISITWVDGAPRYASAFACWH